jgi:hypothetical protein
MPLSSMCLLPKNPSRRADLASMMVLSGCADEVVERHLTGEKQSVPGSTTILSALALEEGLTGTCPGLRDDADSLGGW